MTRDEATNLLANEIRCYWQSTKTARELLRAALAVLAPTPRREPPTVEEVGNIALVWFSTRHGEWSLRSGSYVRSMFDVGCVWLPLSAIPKGGTAFTPVRDANVVIINGMSIGSRGTGGAEPKGGA